ncbi:M15 family metallopeptidase [Spirochaeta isovalerica]|uniref:D-alanyl-D-alanine carboxypeptidase n=1 Tax=Spirochaeta isovalerica TaxID=150 RepID=A0A841REL8_9SPIO|nr:M15 family metallopeptidase [Spirochaeta isovalerica]MBB6480792.1 D-alanyl-D-alanine carboxypeptidase [Spirochaeta isovalerica]
MKIFFFLLLSLTASGCFGGDSMLHPSFDMDKDQLAGLLSDQSEEIRNNILAAPGRFLELADSLLDQPEELFYLADKNHALTRDQGPAETVRPSDYGIPYTRKEREVSSLIIEPLKDLVSAAAKENLEIVFASGYRDYDYQEMLYNRYVSNYGQTEADRFSARPGTSQHQLGTAVDLGTIDDSYALTPEGKWLEAHAGDFGFSLSYPRDMEEVTGYMWECWHYRYITKEGIAMQREFFLDIQQYMMEFWHYHKEDLSAARR